MLIAPMIGNYDFREIITQGYYVDKTGFIVEIGNYLDTGSVMLFCRPRRFGKSLMLSALRYFFSKQFHDAQFLFKRLEVASSPIMEKANTKDVIFLDFKNCIDQEPATLLIKTFEVISNQVRRYDYIKDLSSLYPSEQAVIQRIRLGNAKQSDYESSILILCKLIHNSSGSKPILLFDEYDAQMNEAFKNDSLGAIANFFKNFYGITLKGNTHVSLTILTGVLPFASESLSAGVNNISTDNGIYTICKREYFAFTRKEIEKMAKDTKNPCDLDEIKQWYGGYNYRSMEHFNPWSVLNYFSHGQEKMLYWGRTGSSSMIGKLFGSHSLDRDLSSLFNNRELALQTDLDFSYTDIEKSEDARFTFLYSAGYLTSKRSDDGSVLLYIPNRETREILKKLLLDNVNKSGQRIIDLRSAFLKQDTDALSRFFTWLLPTLSQDDFSDWRVYQSMVAIITALAFEDYYVDQEIVSGEGRCDVFITPKSGIDFGIIIEVKSIKYKTSVQRLNQRAEACLKQISSKNYPAQMFRKGIKKVHAFGIAFCKTSVSVLSETIINTEIK